MSSTDHHYLILDTSILLIWLKVPGYSTCGKGDNTWDFEKINSLIEEEIKNGTYLVLPLASIIETANPITQISNLKCRVEAAGGLVDVIKKTAISETPWMAFSNQEEFWNSEEISNLAMRWLEEVKKEGKVMSLADLSIIKIAELYSQLGTVRILSGDGNLQSYQPKHNAYIPRRSQ